MRSTTCFYMAVTVVVLFISGSEAASRRCEYLSAINACELSCKVLGHTTGACDNWDVCQCSGARVNFFENLLESVGGNVDELRLRLRDRYDDARERLSEWSVGGRLKSLVPSRCAVGEEFCASACKAVGRRTGSCNADATDCDCDDEYVELSEYAKCAVTTICVLDCQADGFASGDCVGEHGWQCRCSQAASVEEKEVTVAVDAAVDGAVDAAVDSADAVDVAVDAGVSIEYGTAPGHEFSDDVEVFATDDGSDA